MEARPILTPNAQLNGAERGADCCEKMPKAFAAGRGVFGVRLNALLDARRSAETPTMKLPFLRTAVRHQMGQLLHWPGRPLLDGPYKRSLIAR